MKKSRRSVRNSEITAGPRRHYGRRHADREEIRTDVTWRPRQPHTRRSTLWDVAAIGGLTDAQLLERFLAGPDELSETAFTALVERHGPTVRRVCLDLLGDRHERKTRAQAAFLVLARNARSIRQPEALGSWLHGVALRLARRARVEAARRHEVERRRAEVVAERNRSKQGTEPELYIELHEEIERLPEKYRSPIVLCYFQGHTQEQASQRLGWPLGTVQTRLHRGRERLRTRLSRRGAALTGLAATVLNLPENPVIAALVPVPNPPGWAGATACAAVRYAARKTTAELVRPSVVRLAEGVLAMMLRDTLKAVALIVLAVGLTGAGVGLGVRAIENSQKPIGPPAMPVARVAPPTVMPNEPVQLKQLARERPYVGNSQGPIGPPAMPVARVAPPVVPNEPVRPKRLAQKQPEIEKAIKDGVRYLSDQPHTDGSWHEADAQARTGTPSPVTLALLDAGEPANSPTITRAVEFLRRFTPDQLHSVYATSLQTMVFAAIDPDRNRSRISANVRWLQDAQIKPRERVNWPGSWTYSVLKNRSGDNSNTQYALLAWIPMLPFVPNNWTI